MKTLRTCFFAAVVAGLLASGSLMADIITIPADGLPQGDIDTLSIALSPLGGALSATAGSTPGWGFTVNWTSTDNDWLVVTGSLIDGESTPALLAQYTDFIGMQNGPYDLGLEAPGTWSETFNNATQQGVGSYQISSNAPVGTLDTGEVTFSFEVWNGDPTISGQQIGDTENDYTYTTAYTVNVVSPEPGTAALLLGALLIGAIVARKRSQLREPSVG